jgi:hypothetical protein
MMVFANGQLLKWKHGHLMSEDKAPGRAAKGQYGFKDNPSQTRFLAFQSKIGWIIALGFGEKKEDDFPPIQITRADDARKWFKQFEDAAVAAAEKDNPIANRGGSR